MCDLEFIFSSDFLAHCDHKASALFGMDALAKMLRSAEQREVGGVWLGLAWQGATAVN